MRRTTLALAALLMLGTAASAEPAPALNWQGWSPDVFAKAKAEGKFVILDLKAVWCHWCHVMEGTTYVDPKVAGLLASKYLTVRVDQDANPDLSNRYGDWGWPATIIFAPDGSELAKRRGYIPPEGMAALLKAVIDDPTPGPSVSAEMEVVPATSPLLDAAQRSALAALGKDAYDAKNGGWGDGQKFIDPDGMDWLFVRAEAGEADAVKQARQTLDAAIKIMDPVAGGIYQYSETKEWQRPHFEKIMWYQANGLRQYSESYARWQDSKHKQAASNFYRYLTTTFQSPEGAFYTSQDADVDQNMPGKAYYALDAKARAALGREPRVDTAVYARENGWAISGLVAYANTFNDPAALAAAEKAATYIVANRRMDTGIYKHGAEDRGGPYLGDTLAMGQAALDLYGATGKRDWLTVAGDAGRVIAAKFKDDVGGYLTSLHGETATGILAKPVRIADEQSQVARFENRVYRTLGGDDFKAASEHAMRYLASASLLELGRPMPGLLVADREVAAEPAHITIVGAKSDARSQHLDEAARAYPARYKRLDWWDTSEGPLANPDVTYPVLAEPAAFVCTNHICSLPLFTADELKATIKRLTSPEPRSPT